MEKLCRRRYGDITQPFVINRNMQIRKIAKFALAVRILRTLKRVNFLCYIKKKRMFFSWLVKYDILWPVPVELSLMNLSHQWVCSCQCQKSGQREDTVFLNPSATYIRIT